MANDQFRAGMAVRRAGLGDAPVDRAESRSTAFDAEFQRYIIESGWSAKWTRPDLDRRTRSLITCAILAARGAWEEFAHHVRATRHTGASQDDLKEMLFHVQGKRRRDGGRLTASFRGPP